MFITNLITLTIWHSEGPTLWSFGRSECKSDVFVGGLQKFAHGSNPYLSLSKLKEILDTNLTQKKFYVN